MNVRRSNGWLTALAMAGLALMALAISTPAARASIQTFSTATGQMNNEALPVNATATFNTNTAGEIVITLTNLLANPTAINQALSDLQFTVGGGSSLTGSSLSTSSGQEITVNGDGTFSLGSTVATGWPYSSTATVGTLDVLASGGVGPTHLIIGPPGPGNLYSNANNSIAGSSPHNPLLNQSASFTITGTTANLPADTIITSATFSFGTTEGEGADVFPGVPGGPGAIVPEPSTMVIAALGALGFVGYGLRRRLKK